MLAPTFIKSLGKPSFHMLSTYPTARATHILFLGSSDFFIMPSDFIHIKSQVLRVEGMNFSEKGGSPPSQKNSYLEPASQDWGMATLHGYNNPPTGGLFGV
jgi:hypothetical protein